MTSSALIRSLTTSTSRYELRADGIIVQRVLTTRVQTMAEARENTTAFLRLAEGRRHPALIDFRIVRAMQSAARDHYADPESTGACTAVALLVASAGSRMLGQHFLKVASLDVPLQVFTDEVEAIAWLRRADAEQRLLESPAV
jgi:hypothetical protein